MEISRIGHGIIAWDGQERRSDRYGSFIVGQKPFDGSVASAAHLDVRALRKLVGKRVHVWCKVVSTRTSGHLGDLFLGIKPTTPDVGEVVELGVGLLDLEDAGWDGLTAIVLRPGDGRAKFWIDPHKLYRLHDQTVDVFVELTTAEFTPPVEFTPVVDPEIVEVGDGSFQAKGVQNDEHFHVPPDVERIGDGLFIMTPISGQDAGRRHKIVK